MTVPTSTVAVALRITAVVNVAAALGALLAPDLNTALLFGPDVQLGGLLWRTHILFWVSVLAMGLGYGLAASDPERQTGLLLAGGIGKLGVAGVWAEMVIAGTAAPLLLAGVVFDAAFGLLFLVYVLPRLRPSTDH